jgi:hypothetical protein
LNRFTRLVAFSLNAQEEKSVITTRYATLPFLLFAMMGVLLPAEAQTGKWSANGTLLEACTCAVPCTCNFGEGPSPHSYCHPVYGYRLDKADWNGVDLSGLIVAGADGPNGISGFLDSRATATQKSALEALAKSLFAQGGPNSGDRKFTSLALIHEVKGNDLRLNIEGRGGFTAKVIVGRDGKSPVVVENNTVWPIARATKAKTSPLSYSDPVTGTIKETSSNANYGAFAFKGSILKGNSAALTTPATDKSCCNGTRAKTKR